MDGQSSPKARLEDAAATMTNEATQPSTLATGLRRQPTKYPHGLNITVQTMAEEDDYSRASTLRSSSSAGSDGCWSESQKYRIGVLGSPETLAELQVRRYKYPLTANYYLNGGGTGKGAAGGGEQKPTPLMLLAYAKRACRWKYMRWPIIFVASVLLFFGLITYCLWLHDVSVARERYLQRRHEATTASTISEELLLSTTMGTTTTTSNNAMLESTRLRAVGMRTRARQPEQTTEMAEMLGETEDEDYDDALLPADSIRFTSGHQNSFGVPIEHDARMLQLLKDLLTKQTTPPTNYPRPLTRVSPTLPPPAVASGKPTAAMTTTPASSSSGGGGCYSTALPMCRGVLEYDLTYNTSAAPRDAEALADYQQLISANCSARAVEFVCAALEPECRPSHIGQLPPCRRICKAILEACSIVIANSDALTELFDCNLYPDAHEAHKCEDPTRRRDFCYEHEFECEDRSCIPQQWQCDNIKDCAGGEDEQQCLVCEQQDEFRCRSNEKCVPETLRCDLNYDCFDGSDEEDCDDYGSGEASPFDEAELNAFPRIFSYASFLSPNQTNEKLYTYITATTDEEAGTETKYQVHQVAAPALNVSSVEEQPAVANGAQEGGPKGFVNFRDSKEIMMTSDSENKFKYSQRSNRTSSSTSSTSSKFSISTTPLRPAASAQTQQRISISVSTAATPTPSRSSSVKAAKADCAAHQLRCVSGKCIAVSQLCDKHVDCPDGADELMCVYRDRLSARRGSGGLAAKNATSNIVATTTPTTTSTTATTTTTTSSTTKRSTVRTTVNRSRKPKS